MRSRDLLMKGAMPVALLIGAVPALAVEAPHGVWIDHTGRGAVEITDCGGALCGSVVWLKDTANAQACGVQILGDVRPTTPGVWDKGWIYDPDSDSKYSVEVKPMGADKLRVMGYMGTKLFSETMVWQRAPADLQRCSTTSAQAMPAAPQDGAENAQRQKIDAPARDAQAQSPDPSANQAKAEPRRQRQANVSTKTCKIDLPWVYVSFPCPD